MKGPSWRRRLDADIRKWLQSKQADDACWREIENAVRNRVRSRAHRYELTIEDAEDLGSEVLLRLLSVLRSGAEERIADFDAYVSRMIDNACKKVIQRDKPVWTLLKDQIVVILRSGRGQEGFAHWKHQHGELGGYIVWQGQGPRGTAHYLDFQQGDGQLRKHLWRLGDPEKMKLPQLLSLIFNWLGSPMRVNELTSLVFALKRCRETESVSFEDLANEPFALDESVDSELVQAIADSYGKLPASESLAFILHLQPEVAEQLLMKGSPQGEDDAVRVLAERAGVEFTQLQQALETIPWSDLRIAELLNIREASDHKTQMRIIHLRGRALRAIRRSVEGFACTAD